MVIDVRCERLEGKRITISSSLLVLIGGIWVARVMTFSPLFLPGATRLLARYSSPGGPLATWLIVWYATRVAG